MRANQFGVWIHQEDPKKEPPVLGKMDEARMKAEMLGKPTLVGFDNMFPDGSIGFACSDCQGLTISGVQLQAKKC